MTLYCSPICELECVEKALRGEMSCPLSVSDISRIDFNVQIAVE